MFSLIKYTRIKYEDYVYPPWGEAVGWLITVASILFVPLLIIKTIVDIYWRENGGENTSQVAVKFKHVVWTSLTERSRDSVEDSHRSSQRWREGGK